VGGKGFTTAWVPEGRGHGEGGGPLPFATRDADRRAADRRGRCEGKGDGAVRWWSVGASPSLEGCCNRGARNAKGISGVEKGKILYPLGLGEGYHHMGRVFGGEDKRQKPSFSFGA